MVTLYYVDLGENFPVRFSYTWVQVNGFRSEIEDLPPIDFARKLCYRFGQKAMRVVALDLFGNVVADSEFTINA